ncbi:unnamed protein product [Dicrocoelium dendriticum]|nr:unnamed protein product [Dicrocoelium dendriticum]
MTLASELDLPLRLLVCRSLFPVLSNNVHQDSVEFRRQAVESEFELIELEPEEDSLEEGEEFGVRRLKSAIESHTWSNMKLLESASCPLRAAYSTDVSRTATDCVPKTQDTQPVLKSPFYSGGKLTDEDTDLQLDETVESFERMFTRLQHARDKLPHLSRPDRQRLAEQVVMEFWHTIGGSSDELNEID